MLSVVYLSLSIHSALKNKTDNYIKAGDFCKVFVFIYLFIHFCDSIVLSLILNRNILMQYKLIANNVNVNKENIDNSIL